MRRAGTALLVAACAVGCAGRSSVPDASHDPTAARQALEDAMDAWKRDQVAGLARRKPPIRFADEDQAAGWKLIDYEVAGEGAEIGGRPSTAVSLTLRDRRGQTV